MFINKVLGLKNTKYEISKDKLEKCDTSFITKTYYNKEADVIYKRTDMEVYFLIENQSTVDKNMSVRILEYEVEILRDIIKNKKENKSNNKNKTELKENPTIIPIVLYTGEEKWNEKTYITETQIQMPGYRNKEFGRYILVDANKYQEEELLKEEGALWKIILLEKSNNIENTYKKISKRKLKKYVKEIIYEYTCNVARLLLSEKVVEEIKEKYKNKQGGESMLLEYLVRAKEEGRIDGIKVGRAAGIKAGRTAGIKVGKAAGVKVGIKKGTIRIAKQLKKMGFKIEDIEKATKLSKDEIEKL